MKTPTFAQYHELIQLILDKGAKRPDRTGVGTISVFNPDVRLAFDLRDAFPAYEGRKLPIEKFCTEMLWFLDKSENTNTAYLHKRGIKYWDDWADGSGHLGAIYGKQWRGWQAVYGGKIDQITSLLQQLKASPYSRRHIVTAWNVGELSEMALPPCHYGFICYVSDGANGEKLLSLNVTIRSSDVIIGLPANIANYAFMTHAIARAVGYVPHELHVSIVGDAHIYTNHESAARELLERRRDAANAQLVWQTESTDIFAYDWHPKGGAANSFRIDNYDPAKAIKLKPAV